MAEEPQELNVPVAWVGTEELPVLYVNQFLGQIGVGADEVFLTIGQITPPPLIGTPEQQRAQASQIAYVPVNPVARLALTRPALENLIELLQQTLTNYDQTQAHRGKE